VVAVVAAVGPVDVNRVDSRSPERAAVFGGNTCPPCCIDLEGDGRFAPARPSAARAGPCGKERGVFGTQDSRLAYTCKE
jgi:hypothetical protein